MKKPKYKIKKEPTQARSKVTVDCIKEAAAQLLKEKGLLEFTTNHVAERAGVSIGSLYQYFPSKEVLIAELKREHFAELRTLIKEAYIANSEQPFERIIESLIVATIDAHRIDPDLHRVIGNELSHLDITEAEESGESIRDFLGLIFTAHQHELKPGLDISLAVKITHRVVESLTHDAVLNQPELLKENQLVDEIKRMIILYLQDPN